MKIRIAGTVNDSVVDGPGIRFVVFTQGCKHNCKGCHNPDTHDINGGYTVDIEDLLKKMFSNPLCDGITVSGGEPFLQINEVAEMCKKTKENGLNVIVYTGFTWEELIKNNENMKIINFVDFLIDGKFIEELKSLDIKFRGSKNQRIIDVKKSLEMGKCVEKTF